MLRQVILSLTFEPYSEMIGHGAVVSERMDSKWANGALQVYAHVTLNLRTIYTPYGWRDDPVDNDNSHPYCCQVNQRYTTCYMEQPHNCNEQLVSQPPWTDVTGLSFRKVKGKTSMQTNRITVTVTFTTFTPGKHWRSGLSGLFDGLGEEGVSLAVGSK